MGQGPYDVFGGNWGLGLPIEWFDESAIETLITRGKTSTSRIDQMVLGWDGEAVDAWEVIHRLLRSDVHFKDL